MSASRSRLLDALDLSRRSADDFIAPTPDDGPPRLFGGQVASQALRAAARTVDEARHANSLHAYFVRAGVPGVPVELAVTRVRDGKSFSIRHVIASQGGDVILVLTASFHVDEAGDDWQLPCPADVPGPDELPEVSPPFLRSSTMSGLEVRLVGPAREDVPIGHPFWIRMRDRLPDDPVVHACGIAFISDLAVMSAARAPNSTAIPFAGASLDHALWFHRPARADEWLLFSVAPTTNARARGLALGTLHARDGMLTASIAQEALLRATAPRAR